MFSLGRHLFHPAARNYARKYATDLRPIQMVYNVFESSNTDAARPPLMVYHGLFGSKQNWRSVCNALKMKTSRKIYNLDGRNHGESPHTASHGSMHMTADLVHLMQQMNINKAALMGHSMGGRAMMYMALKHPELVERVIIIDISPIAAPRDLFAMEGIFNAMRNLQVPKEMSMAEGRKYAVTEMKKVVESETVDFIMLNLRKLPDGSFNWACNVDTLQDSLRTFDNFMDDISGLQPYKGDVLFICGSRSNFMNPESAPRIKQIFPNSEIQWLDAGHLVHYDQPEKFLNLVVQFLK